MSRSLQILGAILLTLILLCFLIQAGLFYAGYWAGKSKLDSSSGDTFIAEQQQIAASQKKLKVSKRSAQTYLSQLSQQLGSLKSSVIRLDALGQKLTNMAKLDSGEFNFSKRLAKESAVDLEFNFEKIEIKDFLKEMRDLAVVLKDRDASLSVLETQIMHTKLEQEIVAKGRSVKIRISFTFLQA